MWTEQTALAAAHSHLLVATAWFRHGDCAFGWSRLGSHEQHLGVPSIGSLFQLPPPARSLSFSQISSSSLHHTNAIKKCQWSTRSNPEDSVSYTKVALLITKGRSSISSSSLLLLPFFFISRNHGRARQIPLLSTQLGSRRRDCPKAHPRRPHRLDAAAQRRRAQVQFGRDGFQFSQRDRRVRHCRHSVRRPAIGLCRRNLSHSLCGPGHREVAAIAGVYGQARVSVCVMMCETVAYELLYLTLSCIIVRILCGRSLNCLYFDAFPFSGTSPRTRPSPSRSLASRAFVSLL